MQCHARVDCTQATCRRRVPPFPTSPLPLPPSRSNPLPHPTPTHTRYVSLLEASTLVTPALCSVDACRQLQAVCAASNDWRLQFGAVGILSDVLQRSQVAAVSTMVLQGEVRRGEMVQLVVL